MRKLLILALATVLLLATTVTTAFGCETGPGGTGGDPGICTTTTLK